jgi:hypothetical protein
MDKIRADLDSYDTILLFISEIDILLKDLYENPYQHKEEILSLIKKKNNLMFDKLKFEVKYKEMIDYDTVY